MRRFWTMIAHYSGGIWNGSEIGRSLGEAHTTVRRHLDALSAALVVRVLEPWFENVGKRVVKSPKVYVRDSGLLHTLLGIPDEGERGRRLVGLDVLPKNHSYVGVRPRVADHRVRALGAIRQPHSVA